MTAAPALWLGHQQVIQGEAVLVGMLVWRGGASGLDFVLGMAFPSDTLAKETVASMSESYPPPHALGTGATVLLSSVFGPFAQDDDYGSRKVNPIGNRSRPCVVQVGEG